jgi:hypothetical protein
VAKVSKRISSNGDIVLHVSTSCRVIDLTFTPEQWMSLSYLNEGEEIGKVSFSMLGNGSTKKPKKQ